LIDLLILGLFFDDDNKSTPYTNILVLDISDKNNYKLNLLSTYISPSATTSSISNNRIAIISGVWITIFILISALGSLIYQRNKKKKQFKEKEEFGRCLICKKDRTNYSWCKICDPQLLTQGWTSGNETIDELIKSTQLKAESFDNHNYLQWVPYDKFKDIEKLSEGGFATIDKATWVEGDKYANINGRFSEDRIIVLKKFKNFQNSPNKFFNEVDFQIFFFLFLFFYFY
jgi:hypothetical protein